MVTSGGGGMQGADNLVRTLHDAADSLNDLAPSEHEAGQLLVESGSAASPRRTGVLASSHSYTVTAGLVTVVAAALYASAVHARNPWLSRTLLAKVEQVVDIYAGGVDDALAQVKGV